MKRLRPVLHVAVAIVAWVVFGLMWWWAFRDLGPARDQLRDLVLVVGLALLVIAVTGMWVAWNVRVWKRGDRREAPPRVAYDYQRDVTGRPVDADFGALRSARYVVIDVDNWPHGSVKRYTPGSEALTDEEVAACAM